MNFYILEKKMTPNVWDENKITYYSPDTDRDIDDPLQPKIDFNHPPFCPLCGKRLNSYPLPPLRREMHVAKPYFGDLVEYGGNLYFSERFKMLYEKSELKGIEQFRKIEILRIVTHNGVRKSTLPPLPTYYLADIVIDGAVMDYKRSKPFFCPPGVTTCNYCKIPLNSDHSLDKYSGLYVDQKRWNGNNIFYLLGIDSKNIVDQKFKDWFDKQHFVTGCWFIPEAEYNFVDPVFDIRNQRHAYDGADQDWK